MKTHRLVVTVLLILISGLLQNFCMAQNITGSDGGWQAYSIAICNNGNLMAWGNNDYGQLGNGTVISSNNPIPVNGVSSVVSVVACSTFVCVLKADSTVWAWGNNYNGELGIGNNTPSHIPVQVSLLSGIKTIVLGDNRMFAIKNDGTVWTWGSGNTTPVQVGTLTGIIALKSPGSGGSNHILALKNDGTVWAWGNNSYGQLGNGNNTSSALPVQVNVLTGVVAIDLIGQTSSLALKNDGTVWAWGENSSGQLGIGNHTNSNVPKQVSLLTGITAIEGGYTPSLALKSDGTVWVWGGSGNVPLQFNTLSGITAISGGYLALKNDGTVWSWGSNYEGQLGNGNNTNNPVPTQINQLTAITSIFGNGNYSFAIKNDGTLSAWGDNSWGQLGNGNITSSNVPLQTNGLCQLTTPACYYKFSTQTLSICNGQHVMVGTTVHNSTAVCSDTLTTYTGCDSIVITNLTVLAAITTMQTFTICDGQSITVANHQYTQTGVYTDTLFSYSHCDSIVSTNLTVLASITTMQPFTICNGQSITVGNHQYTQTGVYADTLFSYSHCDSIVTTNLTVLAPITTMQPFTICNGQSITVGNHQYTQTGVYSDTLVSYSHCDSVITTNLTVLPPLAAAQSFTICGGQTITIASHIYSSSATYIDTLVSHQGCDSVVTTDLTVNPMVHYATTYDSVQNNFTLLVDSSTTYSAIAYRWDFGDGTISVQATPTHTYSLDSLYNVCMKIYTASGDSCMYCHTIGIDTSGNIIRSGGFTLNVLNTNTTTGISQNNFNETLISVYPNPFTNQTVVTFTANRSPELVDGQQQTTLRILDILGKKVNEITVSGKQFILEKGTMQAGIYFLQIVDTHKNVWNRKIIVQ